MPYMHSFLLVAPDEQISTAVLTAGNGSSDIAELMAEALMNVVLEERKKSVGELAPGEPTITGDTPESFKQYAGLYCVGGVYSTGFCRITFDDNTMYRENLGANDQSSYRYKFTTEGGFVRVNDNGKMTADREIVYFEENNGSIYLRTDKFTLYPGLGNKSESLYSGEKMKETDLIQIIRSKTINDLRPNTSTSISEISSHRILYSAANYDIIEKMRQTGDTI